MDVVELETSDGLCLSVQRKEKEFKRLRRTIDSEISNVIAQEDCCTTHMPYSDQESGTTTQQPTVQSSYSCNGTPGWRRVAFLNMTDSSYSCPSGFVLTSYSKRTCGLLDIPVTLPLMCSSTTYSVRGMQYRQVCGMIRGYQVGATSAFRSYGEYGSGINDQYVDGISLTHGPPGSRQHIWTFAAGITEYSSTVYRQDACPCDISNYAAVPPFVGNDYFCESAETSRWMFQNTLYPDDPLWDGQNCVDSSSCCQLNNPPWFTKNLSRSTSDDLELRMCTNSRRFIDDIALEFVDLYVKWTLIVYA